jgi:hypothetical protein
VLGGKLAEDTDKFEPLGWTDNDLMFRNIQVFWENMIISQFLVPIVKSGERRHKAKSKNRSKKEDN